MYIAMRIRYGEFLVKTMCVYLRANKLCSSLCQVTITSTYILGLANEPHFLLVYCVYTHITNDVYLRE